MSQYKPGPAYQANYCRSNLLRPFALEKLEWLRTDSGTSYRLSKSKAPLSSRKAQLQLKEYLRGHKDCQPAIYDFHSHPQRDSHVFAAWYDAPKESGTGGW